MLFLIRGQVNNARRLHIIRGKHQRIANTSKHANIVILDRDPHDVEPDRVAAFSVIRTFPGGRTTYEG